MQFKIWTIAQSVCIGHCTGFIKLFKHRHCKGLSWLILKIIIAFLAISLEVASQTLKGWETLELFGRDLVKYVHIYFNLKMHNIKGY